MIKSILAFTSLFSFSSLAFAEKVFNCQSEFKTLQIQQNLKTQKIVFKVTYTDTKETRTEEAAASCTFLNFEGTDYEGKTGPLTICHSQSENYFFNTESNPSKYYEINFMDIYRSETNSPISCTVKNY